MTDYYERDERSPMAREFDYLGGIALYARDVAIRIKVLKGYLSWDREHRDDPEFQDAIVFSAEQNRLLQAELDALVGAIAIGTPEAIDERIQHFRQVQAVEETFAAGQQG